ncbi:MAG: hypothetical protein LBE38_11485 [Deltaproteobacteria bacterium]|jgi:hypothetical protein|nr:hypothetical protein [Deltaproteobacteria bacterium]
MSEAVINLLLEEISKNKEDLTLFMSLSSAFEAFQYKKINEFHGILLADLQTKINLLNSEQKTEFIIMYPESTKSLLTKWEGGIYVRKKNWIDGICVQLTADNLDAKDLDIQVRALKKNEKANLTFNRLIKEYQFQDKVNEACCPLRSKPKRDVNDEYVWCYFTEKYSSLLNAETFFDLVDDINSKKLKSDQMGKLSSYYIEYLLKLACCLDKALKDNNLILSKQ